LTAWLPYKYAGDDGVVYQIPLPSDFAAALSYVAAAGTEPALPAYLRPRFANYESVSGLQLSSVVIVAPFTASNPPGSITVAGVTYSIVATYGEVRAGYLPSNLILCSGPQGPPGANGTNGTNGAPGLASPAFTSAGQTLQVSHLYTIAHGLSRLPYLTRVYLLCLTGEHGYSPGNAIDLPTTFYAGGQVNGQVASDATNIYFSTSAYFNILGKDSPGTLYQPTGAYWSLYLCAW